MKLSERLARLGTETAFEVLVRARALEAKGRSVVHLEIGEPDFDTPAHVTDAGNRGAQGRGHPLRAGGGAARAAAGDRRGLDRAARRQGHPRDGRGHAGRQADHVLPDPRARGPGRRGALPEPGLPDLRVDDPLHRRGARAGAPARGEGPRARRRPADQQDHAEDAPRSSSTTRTTRPAGSSPRRGCARSPTPRCSTGSPCCPTRSTRRSSTTGKHVSIAAMPGMESLAIVLDGFSKTYAMTGWRLGYGIMPAPLAQVHGEAADERRLLHRELHAARRRRRRSRATTPRSRRWWPSSASAATRSSRACALIPGFKCARPQGAFYVFPNITGTGYGAKAARRPPARRGRRRVPLGHGLRRVGRGPPALQLREQPRQHPGSAAPDQDLPREVARVARLRPGRRPSPGSRAGPPPGARSS